MVVVLFFQHSDFYAVRAICVFYIFSGDSVLFDQSHLCIRRTQSMEIFTTEMNITIIIISVPFHF